MPLGYAPADLADRLRRDGNFFDIHHIHGKFVGLRLRDFLRRCIASFEDMVDDLGAAAIAERQPGGPIPCFPGRIFGNEAALLKQFNDVIGRRTHTERQG